MTSHASSRTPGSRTSSGALALGALDLARALRCGELDVREHLEDVLVACSTTGFRVGAFSHLLEEHSRRRAEAVAARIDAVGSDAGSRERLAAESPLLGVPVPIKDLSRIAGAPWESGSVVMQGTIAEVTDGVPALWEEAGTLAVGKTSTPEFGMPCYTEPATGAPARTPWDLRRTAGGSSGGAAAAVASGVVPLAHGSDGGGSIRIPAACCGVVGMKPSRGLVSSGPHRSDGPGLVTDGVLARSVRDAAAGLDAISRPRAGDSLWSPRPADGFLGAVEARSPLGPLRIGVLTTPLNIETDIHPASLRAVERAEEILRGFGHRVEPIEAPFGLEQWRTFMPLWTVGAAAIPLDPADEERIMPLTRWLREQGREQDGIAVAQALSGMQLLSRRVGEAFEHLDVVLTPSLSGPPAFPGDLQLEDPAADFAAQSAFTPWTSTWNMTGRAAISVPLHREEIDGVVLPLGVHLGGVRPGDDALILRLASQLESADPWPLIMEPVR